MGNYARPTYTDGYEIRYNRESDQFECWQLSTHLSKKDGKPAFYKALGLAIKFMSTCGAQEAKQEEKPKAKLWTPPPSATIVPLEEQLAQLPADAPRCVLVEVPYGTYKEQGYGVYDRQRKELVCPHMYNGCNYVTRSKEEAEKEVAYRQENPPEPVEVDLYLFNLLIPDDEKDEYPEIEPGSEDEKLYEKQKAYWEARKHTSARSQEPEPDEATYLTDRKYTIGEVCSEFDQPYLVVEESFYLSQRDVEDAEDGFDLFLQPGWHTKVRKM